MSVETQGSSRSSLTLTDLASALVERVKPWRELVAIIGVVGGCAAWVGSYFATKQQVQKIECFATESVALARAESAMRFTFDELVQKSFRIDQLADVVRDGGGSDRDRLELKRLQREAVDLEERRRAASARYDQAEKALTDGLCARKEG